MTKEKTTNTAIDPICGMSVAPKVIPLDDAPDPELLNMKRRLWICAALTIPVFILAMAEMLPNFNEILPTRISLWIQFALAIPVVLWGGKPFFERGWAIGQKCQPEYVHADRHRHGRGLFLQPYRIIFSADFFRRFSPLRCAIRRRI